MNFLYTVYENQEIIQNVTVRGHTSIAMSTKPPLERNGLHIAHFSVSKNR